MFRTRRPDCEGRCSMVTFVGAALVLYELSLMDVGLLARVEFRVTAAACLVCALRKPLAQVILRILRAWHGTGLAKDDPTPPRD